MELSAADDEQTQLTDDENARQQAEQDGSDGDDEKEQEDGEQEEDGMEHEDEEEEDESDDSSGSSVASIPLPKKDLPQRTTRGKRMGKLVGDAAEADESFWGQAAFAEEDSDESISSSDLDSSSSEGTDSDIDMPEPEDEEEGGGFGRGRGRGRGGRGGGGGTGRSGGAFVEEDEEGGAGGGRGGRGGGRGGRGRAGYVDPAVRALKGMPTAFSAALVALGAVGDAGAGLGLGAEALAALGLPLPEGGQGEGGVGGRGRKRAGAGVLDVEGAGVGEAEPKAKKGKQHVLTMGTGEAGEGGGGEAPLPPPPKLSQEEVLVDAASTTIESLRVLDSLERGEAERQAGVAAQAGLGKGRVWPPGTALLRWHSKRGMTDTVTFTEVDAVPAVINSALLPPCVPPKPVRCFITGRPAAYLDPLTRKPYADREAFRALRAWAEERREEQEEEGQSEEDASEEDALHIRVPAPASAWSLPLAPHASTHARAQSHAVQPQGERTVIRVKVGREILASLRGGKAAR